MKNNLGVPAREPEDINKQNTMVLEVFKSAEFSVLSFNFEIHEVPEFKKKQKIPTFKNKTCLWSGHQGIPNHKAKPYFRGWFETTGNKPHVLLSGIFCEVCHNGLKVKELKIPDVKIEEVKK